MTEAPLERRTNETLEQKADRLYRFIYGYYMEWAVAPTWKQIAENLKISEKTIPKLLELLQQQGRCLYRPRRWRQIFPREDD